MTTERVDIAAGGRAMRVLVLEDSELDAHLLVRELQQAGYVVNWSRVWSRDTFLASLASRPDVILADYSLPQYDGMSALRDLRERGLDTPFILISGKVGEETAVDAIKQGADDYLLKDRLARLPASISSALESRRLRKAQQAAIAENTRLIHELNERVKELTCLHQASRLLQQEWSDLSELFRAMVDLLPPAFQHPERVRAKIAYCGQEVVSTGFQPTDSVMTAKFTGEDGQVGVIEVAYEAVPASQCEHTFLAEEEQLLETLADSLERFLAHRAAQESLRARESLLVSAQRIANMGSWSMDLEQNRLQCSENTTELFGILTGELGDRLDGFARRIVPEDRSRIEACLRRADSTGGTFEEEYRIHKPDGEVRTLLERGEVILNQDGKPIRRIGVVMDITDRRHVEQSLVESEKRLRMALRAGKLGIFDWNLSTGQFIWSRTHYEVFGYPADDLFPVEFRHLEDRIHLDDLPRITAALDEAKRNKTPFAEEYRVVWPDGEIRWISGLGEFQYDNSGQPIRMLGTVQDVTDRKQAELRLRFSEERFKFIAQATNDAIWDWNLVTDALWWSESFYSQFGYSRADIGAGIESWTSRIHPDDRKYVLSGIENAIHHGPDEWQHEYRFRCKNGSYAYVLDRGHVIRNEQGRAMQMFGGITDLTERRKAEQAVRESEERYRTIVQQSPDIIFINRGGRITFVNRAGITLLRAESEQDILGRSPLDFVHADYHEAVQERIAQLLQAPRVAPLMTQRLVALDGALLDADVQATSFYNDDQLEIQTVCRDITERKRAEEQLHEYVRRTEFSARVGVALSRKQALPEMLQNCAEAMVEYLDAALARIWTLNEEEQVLELLASAGMPTPGDDAASRIPVGKLNIGRIAAEKRSQLTDTLVDDLFAGSPGWAKENGLVAFAGFPLLIEGRCVGVVAMFAHQPVDGDTLDSLASAANGIAQNIDRKLAEESLAALNASLEQRVQERTFELAESERFNRATLDALSAHVAVLDSQANVVATNRAWRRFANENTADVHGVSEGVNYLAVCDAAAASGDVDAAIMAVKLREVLAGERNTWLQEYACHSPTERRWFLCQITQCHIKGQSYAVVAHENVTSIRITQEELRIAKEQADRANRFKSEFLANMSHELRTPLNGILGMNELLLETTLNSQQRQYAEASSASGKLLMQLINDVLDLSKIEAGKLELEERECDLEALVYHVIEIMSNSAERKGLTLTCQLAPEACVTVLCDDNRLQQILVNLVGNATKFTAIGGVYVTGRQVGRTGTTARLRFEVTDSGIGIPKDRADRLFEPFSQVDSSTTRQYGGTGLGLSICRRIVELMGGNIGAESRVGVGSTFWFEIPFTVVKNVANTEHRRRLLGGTRIVTVDCLDQGRKQISECLWSWDCSFEEVKDIQQAFESVTRGEAIGSPVNLVLIDCRAISGDGLRQLRELMSVRRLYVIGLGSPPNHLSKEYLYTLGMRGILHDPVRPSDLFNGMTSALSISDGATANEEEHIAALPGQAARFAGHVLVAEDNRINQLYIVELLKLFGCTCELTTNGEEVLAALEQGHYDLVLMDCQMPEMDGFAASREIRKREASGRLAGRLPIVALTANALKGDRERCLDAGMDEYLSKPIEGQKLRELLDKFLKRSPTEPVDSQS